MLIGLWSLKIQWSGDLMKDGGVYKLSDIFEKRIRW